MSRPPFFSILLPTKNRSEIVSGAIRSVLGQTCPDFELIVSDNDDSPTATLEAVARFSDARIRYCRTSGNLAMHENWDNAFLQARGQHILVLEDKMRLVPNALEVLKEQVSREGTLVSFPVTFVKDSELPAVPLPVRGERWESSAIIDDFSRFLPRSFDRIPKGLDCCAPRELLARIKAESPTGFLFSHVCPDYSFGFMVLSRLDRIVHLSTPLVYVPNNWMWAGKYSNGQATYKKDAIIRRFVQQLPVTPEDIIAHVPVKARYLWINMVLFDFFTKYRRAGHTPAINWADYHAFVMTLILLGRKLGGDMKEETEAVRASLRQKGLGFRATVYLKFIHQLWRSLLRTIGGRLATRRA
jgi:glycosyltransferase involved in cell wall biosynthesis